MKALAFSGGKDSLACWFLCKHEDPYVIWVNTGKAYPETLSVVDFVRSQTTKFIEVKTNQELQNEIYGMPSDIVPIDYTYDGMKITGPKPVMVQSYLQCCWQNISGPLHNAVKNLGVTHLIRGQRIDEDYKSPARDGVVLDGVTYLQPIENWSAEQVLSFISEHMVVPEHFCLDHSSMDCYDCTAFLSKSADRAEWTRIHWPEKYQKYTKRLNLLNEALRPSMAAINDILLG